MYAIDVLANGEKDHKDLTRRSLYKESYTKNGYRRAKSTKAMPFFRMFFSSRKEIAVKPSRISHSFFKHTKA